MRCGEIPKGKRAAHANTGMRGNFCQPCQACAPGRRQLPQHWHARPESYAANGRGGETLGTYSAPDPHFADG
eukprot:11409466-Alexandrium_andersonii.AAC.1